MNVHCWHIVYKHGRSSFITNNFLTRNQSPLKPLECNVQSKFYSFSSVSEHEHMRDWSMLVLYCASCGSQQCGQFVCTFTHLSVPSRPPHPQCLQNSNCKYLSPMPKLDFQLKESSLAFGIQKKHLWYRYGYFLESPK